MAATPSDRPNLYNGEEPFIFISYSHKDSDLVYPIIDCLLARGYRVWYDDSIYAGTNFVKALAEKIEQCAVFIAMLTPNYTDSAMCVAELRHAFRKNKTLIGVKLKQFELPPEIDFMYGARAFLEKFIYSEEEFYGKLFLSEGLGRCLLPPSQEPTQSGQTSETETTNKAETESTPTPDPPQPPPSRKKPWYVWVLGGLCIVLLVIAIKIIFFPPDPPSGDVTPSPVVTVAVEDFSLFYEDQELGAALTLPQDSRLILLKAVASPAASLADAVFTWQSGDEALLRLTPSADSQSCICELLGAQSGGVRLSVSCGALTKDVTLCLEETPVPTEQPLSPPSSKDIEAAKNASSVVQPNISSYLPQRDTLYVDNLSGRLAVNVYKRPDATDASKIGTAYHGSRVTVLAEQDALSFILYYSQKNELLAAWILTDNLSTAYPAATVKTGSGADVQNARSLGDPEVAWSNYNYPGTKQKYTVLAEPIEGCVCFTLDYQITSRNGTSTQNCAGPRTIYVNTGDEWVQVGQFDFDAVEPIHVVVNLAEPTTLTAVATVASCNSPDTFTFRQSILDVKCQG